MARPKKHNLDYFSHDNNMRNDKKLKAVRSKFGLSGYAIYNMLLEAISEENGLQLKIGEIDLDILAGDFSILSDELKKMIDYFTADGINLFQVVDGYLRCGQLENRSGMVFEKREKSLEDIRNDISEAETIVSEAETIVSDAESTQRIVKNSKEKNRIVKGYSENCLFLYALYPSTDKNNQGRSTGKCGKCKDKIESILKTRSFEELKTVFENYLLLSEKKGSWLKNFETFLNQLPEPVEISEVTSTEKYEPIDPCRTILPRRKPSDYE